MSASCCLHVLHSTRIYKTLSSFIIFFLSFSPLSKSMFAPDSNFHQDVTNTWPITVNEIMLRASKGAYWPIDNWLAGQGVLFPEAFSSTKHEVGRRVGVDLTTEIINWVNQSNQYVTNTTISLFMKSGKYPSFLPSSFPSFQKVILKHYPIRSAHKIAGKISFGLDLELMLQWEKSHNYKSQNKKTKVALVHPEVSCN